MAAVQTVCLHDAVAAPEIRAALFGAMRGGIAAGCGLLEIKKDVPEIKDILFQKNVILWLTTAGVCGIITNVAGQQTGKNKWNVRP